MLESEEDVDAFCMICAPPQFLGRIRFNVFGEGPSQTASLRRRCSTSERIR